MARQPGEWSHPTPLGEGVPPAASSAAATTDPLPFAPMLTDLPAAPSRPAITIPPLPAVSLATFLAAFGDVCADPALATLARQHPGDLADLLHELAVQWGLESTEAVVLLEEPDPTDFFRTLTREASLIAHLRGADGAEAWVDGNGPGADVRRRQSGTVRFCADTAARQGRGTRWHLLRDEAIAAGVAPLTEDERRALALAMRDALQARGGPDVDPRPALRARFEVLDTLLGGTYELQHCFWDAEEVTAYGGRGSAYTFDRGSAQLLLMALTADPDALAELESALANPDREGRLEAILRHTSTLLQHLSATVDAYRANWPAHVYRGPFNSPFEDRARNLCDVLERIPAHAALEHLAPRWRAHIELVRASVPTSVPTQALADALLAKLTPDAISDPRRSQGLASLALAVLTNPTLDGVTPAMLGQGVFGFHADSGWETHPDGTRLGAGFRVAATAPVAREVVAASPDGMGRHQGWFLAWPSCVKQVASLLGLPGAGPVTAYPENGVREPRKAFPSKWMRPLVNAHAPDYRWPIESEPTMDADAEVAAAAAIEAALEATADDDEVEDVDDVGDDDEFEEADDAEGDADADDAEAAPDDDLGIGGDFDAQNDAEAPSLSAEDASVPQTAESGAVAPPAMPPTPAARTGAPRRAVGAAAPVATPVTFGPQADLFSAA